MSDRLRGRPGNESSPGPTGVLARLWHWLMGQEAAARVSVRGVEPLPSPPVPDPFVAFQPPEPEPPEADIWRYSALSQAFQDLLFQEADDTGAVEPNELERHVQDRVLDRLAKGIPLEELPRLPASLDRLLGELEDEAAFARLRETIRRDPALAGEVIRLANSAWFRRGSRPVTGIDHAVGLLGQDGLRCLVATLLMAPVLRIKPIYYRLFGRALWDHSLACAQACRRVAGRMGQDESTAYFLGLVHNVGKIMIFGFLVETFARVDPGVRPRPAVFRRLIDGYGQPLAARIAAGWGLPAVVVTALEEQPRAAGGQWWEVSPLGQVLFLGNLLATARLLLDEQHWPPERVEEQLRPFGLSRRHLTDLGFG